MRTTTLFHCGVSLLCTYEYEPAESQTWDHPGSPEEATVTSIKVGGVEIRDLLKPDQIDRIEEKILESLEAWEPA